MAGVAAWVSYWHLVELARMAGEEGIAAHLLPLSVDGLVVVASAYLRDTDTRRPASKAAPVCRVAPVSAPALASAGPVTPKATSARVAPARSTATTDAGGDGARRAAPPVRGTAAAELVRQLAVEHPDWTQAQVAEAVGCSVRTVRRHLTGGTDIPVEAVTDADLDALLDELAPAAEPATNGAHQ